MVFSAIVRAAVAPAPSEVITGASFTLVTVAASACVSVKTPSLALTITSYTLFAPASVGASKLGAATNVNTPDVALIANLAESAPPVIA